MSRRLASLLLAVVAGCAGGDPEPPNFVLISVDTLRWSALRAFDPDAPANPTLDALAEQSLRFGAALSPASWTLPAHASLLTGLYSDRHGATDSRVTLAAEIPTLAGRLGEQGYETVGFTGGGFLSRGYGLARGFDRYDDWTGSAVGAAITGLPRGGAHPEVPSEAVFDRALAYLEQRQAADPAFFLFLHTYAVHDYFKVQPRSVQATPEQRTALQRRHQRCLLGRQTCPPEDWERLRRLYALEVAWLDRELGRLLALLSRRGLDDSTVVILVSDHGEGFEPERGRIHHGGRLHADQLRVPLLIRVPGVAARDVETPVSLVDLAPTLLEWAGAASDPSFDGRSLAGLIRGADLPPPRLLFAMEHEVFWSEGGRARAPGPLPLPIAAAVVDDGSWYIRSRRKGSLVEELYDTNRDPDQRENLSERQPPPLQRAREGVRERARRRPQTPAVEKSDELREQLEALGYAS